MKTNILINKAGYKLGKCSEEGVKGEMGRERHTERERERQRDRERERGRQRERQRQRQRETERASSLHVLYY